MQTLPQLSGRGCAEDHLAIGRSLIRVDRFAMGDVAVRAHHHEGFGASRCDHPIAIAILPKCAPLAM